MDDWREWASKNLDHWFWIYVRYYRANTHKLMWRYSVGRRRA